MNHLKVAESLLCDDNIDVIYVIAADPSWEHYDPVKCPKPIREWIEKNYPSVTIAHIDGFLFRYIAFSGGDAPEIRYTTDFQQPIFWVGFNADQAEHFINAWTTPPLNMSSEFYFLTLDPKENFSPEQLAAFREDARQPEAEITDSGLHLLSRPLPFGEKLFVGGNPDLDCRERIVQSESGGNITRFDGPNNDVSGIGQTDV